MLSIVMASVPGNGRFLDSLYLSSEYFPGKKKKITQKNMAILGMADVIRTPLEFFKSSWRHMTTTTRSPK